jgi:hypothetical protein
MKNPFMCITNKQVTSNLRYYFCVTHPVTYVNFVCKGYKCQKYYCPKPPHPNGFALQCENNGRLNNLRSDPHKQSATVSPPTLVVVSLTIIVNILRYCRIFLM